MTYQDQLKSPKWQKKRLEILERDNFTCQICGNKNDELHVHHIFYTRNTKLWDYENYALITLCGNCHEWIHDANKDVLMIAVMYLVKVGQEKFEKTVHLFGSILSLK